MVISVCLPLWVYQPAGAAARDKGLVARWDFNEGKGDVLNDRSGNNNHGKIHGARWVKCGKGHALLFDGVDDYVDCGNGKSLDITGPITLQAWVRPTVASQGEPGIVGKFYESYCMTSYQGNAYFYVSSGGNKVRLPLKTYQWTHLAGAFDGTTLGLYLNGQEVAKEKSKFTSVNRGSNFRIGCIFGDPAAEDAYLRKTAFFPGLIDSVRAYNRALSQREIIHCYNLEAADKGQEPFDTSKFGRLLLEPFFYPRTDKAVLSVNCRWVLPLPEAAKVCAEFVLSGSNKVLQSKVLNPNAARNEDELEASLKGLKKGTYELRALVRTPDKVIQAENFARASAGVKAYANGSMAGRINLFGGWAEYDFLTPPGEYRLWVWAARIHDAAGIRCTIDGRDPAEINLNGPYSGGPTAWANARWERVGSYRLAQGRHTLRIETLPVRVEEKKKTYSRYAYIDALSLDRETSEAQGPEEIERVTFRYPFEPLLAVASPKEHLVPPLPPAITPPQYQVQLGKGGGFTVSVRGQIYRIESSYSYPRGGENRLLAAAADTKGEASWKVASHQLDAKTYLVNAGGDYYAVSRRVRLQPTRIMVEDTIRSNSGDAIGILLSNYINVRGVDDARVTNRRNPTIFVGTKDNGVGIIPLDDLYHLRAKTISSEDRAEVRDEHFGLDRGASYTIQWAVYPTATSDYYDFINQVRKDEHINGYVEGTLGLMGRRKPLPAETVDRKNIAYARMGCLGKPPDDPTVSLEGFEFVEYPIESKLIKKTFAESKALYPNMRVMFHVAHSLYACNKPEERFPDSRALRADGSQLHYGPNTIDYYGRYFSKERFDEGWRWWVFYPTIENSFGSAIIKAMEYMLDDMGATGMWADGFIPGYVRGGYSYDRWDGHSVIIDPKTKLVVRKVTCVPWVALPVLKKVVRMIEARGGITFTGHPGPRSMWKEAMIACCETGGGDAVPLGGIHLGRCLMALGNPYAIKNARDIYRDILNKLDHGALYTWYGDREYMQRKTLIEHMYPITFESIHEGTVRGRERIVTKKSGVYGWHGDRSLHAVYLYDARGALTRHNFITTVDRAGVRTELELGKDESAALVKLPVTATASRPVNLNLRQYDAKCIRMALNGQGDIALTIRSGRFEIQPGATYTIKSDRTQRVDAAGDGVVSSSLTLDGPVTLRVEKD